MNQRENPPKVRSMQWPKVRSMQWPKARSMQWFARRIRVPLGFVTAAIYVFEVARRPAHPAAIAWSLVLVLPGLALRAAASGTVKKNRELAVTGPYAYTRNPLYLGSMLMAAGFAVALLSWPLALLLAAGFALIYIPVIAGEEQFLRDTFPGYEDYCRRVPRLLPRFLPRHTAAKAQDGQAVANDRLATGPAPGGFSFALYLRHREYNAALGAALLYLSLLYLRPALEILLDRFR
jgi:protein-S-isoprenylcysteine O-methyltransferase Ste14